METTKARNPSTYPMPMIRDSYLYKRWYEQTVEPPSNDFVIAISASGKSTMSRTGKTSLETILAECLDQTEDGFDAEEKATLDAGELAYEVVPDVENHSAVALEEAQGSPGTVGLDSRRGMVQEVIDAISSILNNGNKELTIIITAQHLPMLDKRVAPMVDAWILIRHGPSSPRGPLAIHHGMEVEDYNFRSPQIKTPAYEEFTWPKLAKGNTNYNILEEKKEAAKRKAGNSEAEDDGLSDTAQIAMATKLRRLGLTWHEVADGEGMEYSHEWYRQRVDDDVEKSEAINA